MHVRRRVIDRPELRALSPIGECERLEKENAMLREAIAAFVKASELGADTWKAQPHIKRLFDIANIPRQTAERTEIA